MDKKKYVEIKNFTKQFEQKYKIVIVQYVYTPEFNTFYLWFSFGINKSSIKEVINLFKHDYENQFDTKLKQHNKIPMAMGTGHRYTDVVFDFFEENPKAKVPAVRKIVKRIKTSSVSVNSAQELMLVGRKVKTNKPMK